MEDWERKARERYARRVETAQKLMTQIETAQARLDRLLERRAKIIREAWDEGHPFSHIADWFQITRARAHQIAKGAR